MRTFFERERDRVAVMAQGYESWVANSESLLMSATDTCNTLAELGRMEMFMAFALNSEYGIREEQVAGAIVDMAAAAHMDPREFMDLLMDDERLEQVEEFADELIENAVLDEYIDTLEEGHTYTRDEFVEHVRTAQCA